jgi:hypothetical protein
LLLGALGGLAFAHFRGSRKERGIRNALGAEQTSSAAAVDESKKTTERVVVRSRVIITDSGVMIEFDHS